MQVWFLLLFYWSRHYIYVVLVIGAKLDSHLHKISEVREGLEDGIILEQVRPGIKFNDVEVIRKALVVSSTIVEKSVSDKTSTITDFELSDNVNHDETHPSDDSILQ